MGQFTMPDNAKKLEWKVTMHRDNAFPLDMSSVFSNESAALEYVKGNKTDVGKPYIGQIITVTAENDDPKTYCINKIGTPEDNYSQLTSYCNELGAGSGADITLDSEIKVEGGPLADLLKGKGIESIPSGTSFEDFVSLLTRQELWPSLSYSEAKIDASIDVPTITFVQTDSTLEVGTPITMKAMTFSGTTIVSSSPCKVVGFTHGYSSEKSGNNIINATAITAGNKTTGVTENGYARKFNITSGFDGDGKTPNLPSTVTGVAVSGMNTSACTIGCLSEGSNTITLNVTGGTASVSCDAIDSHYIVSNFGNRDDDHKSNKNTQTTASDAPTNNTTKTITGKYKYFIGNSRKTSPAEFDSDGIRNLDIKSGFLNNSGNTDAIGSDLITSDGYSIVIACPEGYELKTVKGYMDADLTGDFDQTGIVSVKTGEIDTNYNVYIYDITTYTPVDFGKVVIGKK